MDTAEDTPTTEGRPTSRTMVVLRSTFALVGGHFVPLTVWAIVRATQIPTAFPCGPESGGPPCGDGIGQLVIMAALSFFGALFFGIVAAITGGTPPRLGRLFGLLYLAGLLLGVLLAEPVADAYVRILA